jgi:dihydrodipicolinate synthase/N-acetylneuraminate lyase
MTPEEVCRALHEHVVAVTTTIWREPGMLDLEACAANTNYLLDHGVSALVCAGIVGEHDRLSVDAQKVLMAEIAGVVRDRDTPVCLGAGLGRTIERIRALVPALAKSGVDYAMLVPPPIDDPEAQFAYYDEALRLLRENGVWPMLYNRPEHPLGVEVMQRLFAAHDIPAVKLGTSDQLPTYAHLVQQIGCQRTAWLCGVSGSWMPAYYALGMARGMSSGIVNAFPERPQNLLRRILSGNFDRDAEYWTFVQIEALRRSGPGMSTLVLKALQEMVGLRGGMNGDGQVLPEKIRMDVYQVVKKAGWVD